LPPGWYRRIAWATTAPHRLPSALGMGANAGTPSRTPWNDGIVSSSIGGRIESQQRSPAPLLTTTVAGNPSSKDAIRTVAIRRPSLFRRRDCDDSDERGEVTSHSVVEAHRPQQMAGNRRVRTGIDRRAER
jgi:hypothetical protein